MKQRKANVGNGYNGGSSVGAEEGGGRRCQVRGCNTLSRTGALYCELVTTLYMISTKNITQCVYEIHSGARETGPFHVGPD